MQFHCHGRDMITVARGKADGFLAGVVLVTPKGHTHLQATTQHRQTAWLHVWSASMASQLNRVNMLWTSVS